MTTETKHAELRECPVPRCGATEHENGLFVQMFSEERGHGAVWGNVSYQVKCRVCGATGLRSEDRAEAITAWNARTSDARIAELEALLRQYDYQLGGETDAVKKRFADLRRDTRAALGEQS